MYSESSEPIAAPVPASTGRTALACVAGFVLPGLGHVALGRFVRGIIIGGAILAMFFIGFAMQGHIDKPVPGEWLTWFFSVLNAGMGLPYVICLLADIGVAVTPEQAAKVTFEYGNTFLRVAGALNVLAVLDAYDIGVGRKA